MVDGTMAAMDEFWKERIGREMNRLCMPDASGEIYAPGSAESSPNVSTPRRNHGIAGTQLSARFHSRFMGSTSRYPEVGSYMNLDTSRRSASLTTGPKGYASQSQVLRGTHSGKHAKKDFAPEKFAPHETFPPLSTPKHRTLHGPVLDFTEMVSTANHSRRPQSSSNRRSRSKA